MQKTQHTAHKVADKLWLIRSTASVAAPKVTAPDPVHHMMIIDCSGSMTGDLPRIREQLKRKLPKLIGENDAVSILWFSGRNEFGVLIEAEPVPRLTDLEDVNRCIDRWLRPVGMTGFKEPLEEAGRVIDRAVKKSGIPKNVSLMFMSDGCDNQWPRADILKVVEKVAPKLVATTIVEYGYYADRALLAAMAQKAGGAHIFAEDFDRYQPIVEKTLARKPVGKRIEIEVPGDAIGGFAYALGDGDLLTFTVEGGKVTVPEDMTTVAWLSPTQVGNEVSLVAGRNVPATLEDCAVQHSLGTHMIPVRYAYAALSLFAVRMMPEVMLPILKALSDTYFIKEYGGLFGKQKYTQYMEEARIAVFSPTHNFRAGRDPKAMPADDAFTVLELLETLADDDKARVILDHPDFKYSRISRGRVSADENLSADEQDKLDKLRDEMGKTKKAKELKALQAQIDTLLAAKRDALVFTADPAPDGYPICNLTYNEDRPNISLLVRKTGTVDLSPRVQIPAGVPTTFPTFIFRNYAIVRDGMVNVEKLPVVIDKETYTKLAKAGVTVAIDTGRAQYGDRLVGIIDLRGMPILNRNMVKRASAKALFDIECALVEYRCKQKVYNTFKNEKYPRVSEGFAEKYGKAAADWLKEQGITDYSGFSPKMVQAESKDFYIGKELTVGLKGFATIPSLNDVRKRVLAGKKLTGPAAFMLAAMADCEMYFAKEPERKHEGWLDARCTDTTKIVRQNILNAARIKFAVTVGQTWFTEWKSIDENTMPVKILDETVEGKIEMKEVEIHI